MGFPVEYICIHPAHHKMADTFSADHVIGTTVTFNPDWVDKNKAQTSPVVTADAAPERNDREAAYDQTGKLGGSERVSAILTKALANKRQSIDGCRRTLNFDF